MVGTTSDPASHQRCAFSSGSGLQTEERGVCVARAAAGGTWAPHWDGTWTSAAAGRRADGTTHAPFGGGLGLRVRSGFWGVFVRGCSFSLFFPVAISIFTCSLRRTLLTPFQPATANTTQYNAIQHNTTHYNTIQQNPTQFNIISYISLMSYNITSSFVSSTQWRRKKKKHK